MSRDDDERLPEGMRRVGYDADTQVYTFQDSDGSYWEGAPGCEYGHLTRVGQGQVEDADDTQPFLPDDGAGAEERRRRHWRHEMMPLLNFGLILGVFFLVLIWFLGRSSGEHSAPAVQCPLGSAPYSIRRGDTCWALAKSHEITLDELISLNDGIECQNLSVGKSICLPAAV